jgi:hypothetical protein
MPQRLLLILLATWTLSVLCAMGAVVFIVVREWWWNRDRSRHVMAMLHQERAIDEAAAVLGHHQMTAQLEQIRALPEVFEPVGP